MNSPQKEEVLFLYNNLWTGSASNTREVDSLVLSSCTVTAFSFSQSLQTHTVLKLIVFTCITYWVSLFQSGRWVREISFPLLKPSRGLEGLMVELIHSSVQSSTPHTYYVNYYYGIIFPTYSITMWCMMQWNVRVWVIQRKCWKSKAEKQLSFEITLVSLHLLKRNKMRNYSLSNRALIYPFF